MSYSISELKRKDNGQRVFHFENDTVGNHYLFDENCEQIAYYDFGCDAEIEEKYDVVTTSEISEDEWKDIFKKLKQKIIEY